MDRPDFVELQERLGKNNKDMAAMLGVSAPVWSNAKAGRGWKKGIPEDKRAALHEAMRLVGMNGHDVEDDESVVADEAVTANVETVTEMEPAKAPPSGALFSSLSATFGTETGSGSAALEDTTVSLENVIKDLEKAKEAGANLADDWKYLYDSVGVLSPENEDLLLNWVKEQTGVRKQILRDSLQESRDRQQAANSIVNFTVPETPPPTREELAEQCQHLINCTDILAEAVRVAHTELGVIGEEDIVKGVYMAAHSPRLGRNNTISVAVRGESSTGKSHTAGSALKLTPSSAYYLMTSASEKSLFNMRDGELRETLLFVNEANRLTQEDSEMVAALRGLISEGEIRYQVSVKEGASPTGEGGEWVTKTNVVEGPTALLTTTTKAWLDDELETRLLALDTDDSKEQTRRILRAQASGVLDRSEPDLSDWHAFFQWVGMGNRMVTVGDWAQVLADLIPDRVVRVRRDFPRLMGLAKVSAFIHQAHRDTEQYGRIIADLRDYAAARPIIIETLDKGAGYRTPDNIVQVVDYVMERLHKANAEMYPQGVPKGFTGMTHVRITVHQIAAGLKLAYKTAHRRIRKAIADGYVENIEDRPKTAMQLGKGVTEISTQTSLPETEVMQRLITGKIS